MASQTVSGFATEGTQYASDNSYYLLDRVPGSGSVLEGPITITGNLVTTGTTTSQGALAAPSVNVATGVTAQTVTCTEVVAQGVRANRFRQPLGSQDPMSVEALTRVDIDGPDGVNIRSTGSQLGPNQGRITITGSTLGTDITLEARANGGINLANSAQRGLFVQGPTAAGTLGASVSVVGRFGMDTGLRLLPNEGSFDNPVQATLQTPGGYLFEMDGNKAFVTTGSAAVVLIVRLPVTDNNWVINYGAIGAPTSLNVGQVVTGGGIVTFNAANILAPITMWITCM